jgi:hypothetical protein
MNSALVCRTAFSPRPSPSSLPRQLTARVFRTRSIQVHPVLPRPGDIGSTGSKRSNARMALFPSTQNTAAGCGRLHVQGDVSGLRWIVACHVTIESVWLQSRLPPDALHRRLAQSSATAISGRSSAYCHQPGAVILRNTRACTEGVL